MTNLKKLSLIAVIAGGLIGMQASGANFDYTLLKPLVKRSEQAVDAVSKALNGTKAACLDAKAFVKNLYTQQKNALKVIKAELKQTYKVAKASAIATWYADKKLYKAYKKLYKNWKKTGLFPAV